MKTTMKNFKFLILFFALIFCGCPDVIEIISGDSQMKIINDCNYSVKIYFDDSYIGKINSDEEETWSVPSGKHSVEATCSFAENYKESYDFYPGQITLIRLEIANQFSKSGFPAEKDSTSIEYFIKANKNEKQF